MDKIKLNLKKRECITKSFANQEIKIIPYISLEDVDAIVGGVFELTLDEIGQKELISNEDKIIALTRLNQYIVDKCSNIDIDAIEYSILTTSGLEQYVLKFVTNYELAKEMLLFSICEYNQGVVLLSAFDVIPDANNMNGQLKESANILKDIDNDKLKMIVSNIFNDKVSKVSKSK